MHDPEIGQKEAGNGQKQASIELLISNTMKTISELTYQQAVDSWGKWGNWGICPFHCFRLRSGLDDSINANSEVSKMKIKDQSEAVLPDATCPVCGRAVFFRRGPTGGGAYFNKLGKPWPKHSCTRTPPRYSPFNRARKPKLRNRRFWFERNGWQFLRVEKIEKDEGETIVRGVSLSIPVERNFRVSAQIDLDPQQPVCFRLGKGTRNLFELSFRTHLATKQETAQACEV